jgi:NitT/TauT family transport system ATP-binding protein
MRKRASLAQTLVLDPDIILMDEPFSALDIQTRQLMENECCDAVAGQAQGGAVHHPRPGRGHRHERPRGGDEAGPASHPIGEFSDRHCAPARRGRDQDHATLSSSCTQAIWDVLRDEVLKGYRNSCKVA